MRFFPVILIICLLFQAPLLFAENELSSGQGLGIEQLLEQAISDELIAGGVAVVGNGNGILSTTARGALNSIPGAPPLDEQTIFDIASLTKVIATTPAIMKLLDEGRISLSDPLGRWFSEFRGPGRDDITILHLLTHTSGLVDFHLRPWQGMDSAIRKAANQKHRLRAGTSFNYADINFILLGELVYRVSGKPLDIYCREELFEPLGAHSTMFAPPETISGRIAPTEGFTGGIVQDMNARRLGNVAGHAGLFSSAHDLSLFARLILGGGAIDGRRILSERAVKQMTTPYFCSNGKVIRALGWDMESPFSAPKGSFFSENSFGHTGYSGSSIWIDPRHNMFVVLLTNRLNYRQVSIFNNLRRNVSTVAAGYSLAGNSHVLPWEVAWSDTVPNTIRPAAPDPSVSKVSKVSKIRTARKSSRKLTLASNTTQKKMGKKAVGKKAVGKKAVGKKAVKKKGLRQSGGDRQV